MTKQPFNNNASQAERFKAYREEQRRQAADRAALRPGDHEPTTLHALARVGEQLEGGRFAAKVIHTGTAERVDYPAAGGPWSSGYAAVPPEEPIDGLRERDRVGRGTWRFIRR